MASAQSYGQIGENGSTSRVDGDNDSRIGRVEDEEKTAQYGESTPLFPSIRDPATLVSTHRTLMNFLRAMVGPGCLSLPAAFKFSGLWTGFGLMFIVAYVNTHCMALLVECAQYLCAKKRERRAGLWAFGEESVRLRSCQMPKSQQEGFICG